MLPKAFGEFSRKDDHIYRTEARLVWGGSGRNLGLVIMLNPGSSKLLNNNIWKNLVDKKIDQADGELLLDDTMKALAIILEKVYPCLDGILHIRNLFNIRNSDSADALALYGQHSKGTIKLDATLLHSDFKDLLVAGNGYKNFTSIDNPWIWLGWTVEDKKFLNLRKREIWDICQNLSKQVHYFAIYSKSKKYKNTIPRIHAYHPCPQKLTDKIQYKDDMIAQMKEHLPKVYIVAMSDDKCYVLLKWEDSYALENNGISPNEAKWEKGVGLVVSVQIKGDYEWFDDPILYDQQKELNLKS